MCYKRQRQNLPEGTTRMATAGGSVRKNEAPPSEGGRSPEGDRRWEELRANAVEIYPFY